MKWDKFSKYIDKLNFSEEQADILFIMADEFSLEKKDGISEILIILSTWSKARLLENDDFIPWFAPAGVNRGKIKGEKNANVK